MIPFDKLVVHLHNSDGGMRIQKRDIIVHATSYTSYFAYNIYKCKLNISFTSTSSFVNRRRAARMSRN